MKNMLNLPPEIIKTLTFVSVTSFIVSCLFTVLLMTSGAYGIIAVILAAVMGVLMQSGEILTGYLAINQLLPGWLRSVCAILCLIFLGASIFASTSYLQNQANETANNAALNSAEYSQAQEARGLRKGDSDAIRAQVSQIEADKNKYKAERTETYNAYPSDYVTVKSNHAAETAAQVDKYNAQITGLQGKVEGINGELAIPLSVGSVDVKSSSGYTAMFELIADRLNKGTRPEQDQWTAEQVSAQFFFIIGLTFELLSLITGAVAMLNKGSTVIPSMGRRSTKEAGFKASYSPAMQHQDNYPDQPIMSQDSGTDAMSVDLPQAYQNTSSQEYEYLVDPNTGARKRPAGFNVDASRSQNVGAAPHKPVILSAPSTAGIGSLKLDLSKSVDVAPVQIKQAFKGAVSLLDVQRYVEYATTHAKEDKVTIS